MISRDAIYPRDGIGREVRFESGFYEASESWMASDDDAAAAAAGGGRGMMGTAIHLQKGLIQDLDCSSACLLTQRNWHRGCQTRDSQMQMPEVDS